MRNGCEEHRELVTQPVPVFEEVCGVPLRVSDVSLCEQTRDSTCTPPCRTYPNAAASLSETSGQDKGVEEALLPASSALLQISSRVRHVDPLTQHRHQARC